MHSSWTSTTVSRTNGRLTATLSPSRIRPTQPSEIPVAPCNKIERTPRADFTTGRLPFTQQLDVQSEPRIVLSYSRQAERPCFHHGGRLIVSYHTFRSLWRFGPSRFLTVDMLVLGCVCVVVVTHSFRLFLKYSRIQTTRPPFSFVSLSTRLTTPRSETTPPTTPRTIVHVQAILFTSLGASLFSAFLAMLGKQWLTRSDPSDMRRSVVERSRNRQRKLDGIVAWYFDYVMEPLPPLLQAALSVVGRLLPAAKMARARGIAGVAIGNCGKVGWQRVAALSARSAMSSYAQATVVYFTVHILLFHSTYISDGWRPEV